MGYIYTLVTSPSDDSLSIFDVSTPSSPTLEGVISGSGSPNYLNGVRNIDVVGNYAYVSAYNDNSLTIIDISDLSTPTFVGKISGAGSPNYLSGIMDAKVVGDYAYTVSNFDNSLSIFNISTPSNPTLVGEIHGAGSPNYLDGARSIEIVGNYAYVAAFNDNSLTIINISNPSSPTFAGKISGIGSPNYLGGPQDVSIVGDYAYVVSYNDNALTVINISSPSTPLQVGEIDGAGYPNYLGEARSIDVIGDYAYITSNLDNALVIFDISSPTTPTLKGSIDGAGSPNYLSGAQGAKVVGNYAYVASYVDDALTIFNISNPFNITHVGEIYGYGSPNYLNGAHDLFTIVYGKPSTFQYLTMNPDPAKVTQEVDFETKLWDDIDDIAIANVAVNLYDGLVVIGTAITNASGIATFSSLSFTELSKTLKVYFSGNDTYSSNTLEDTFTFNKCDTILSNFIINPDETYVGETINFSSTLNTEFGEAIIGKTVRLYNITLASDLDTDLTDVNGRMSIDKTFTYELINVFKCIFDNTSIYNTSESDEKVLVISSVAGVNMTLGVNTNTVEVLEPVECTVRLWRGDTGDPLSNKYIELKDNSTGVVYGSGYTDSSGYLCRYIQFEIPVVYNIVAYWSGDGWSDPVTSTKVVITVRDPIDPGAEATPEDYIYISKTGGVDKIYLIVDNVIENIVREPYVIDPANKNQSKIRDKGKCKLRFAISGWVLSDTYKDELETAVKTWYSEESGNGPILLNLPSQNIYTCVASYLDINELPDREGRYEYLLELLEGRITVGAEDD